MIEILVMGHGASGKRVAEGWGTGNWAYGMGHGELVTNN